MKRRIITLALALGCMFAVPTVSYAVENTIPFVEDIVDEGADIATYGNWIIDERVDDFGDSIGEKYLKTFSEGTFSNTATTNSELSIVLFYTPEKEEFCFRLLEYNDVKATYFESSEIQLKMKVDDTVYEHNLWSGTAPNGDIYVADKYEQLVNAQKTGNSKELFNKLSFDDSAYQQLYTFLSEGKEVRCVIYIDNSKYSFSVLGNGFQDSLNAVSEEKYCSAVDLMTDGNYNAAIELFTEIKNYKDSDSLIAECNDLLSENRMNSYNEELSQIYVSLTDMYNGNFSDADNVLNFFKGYADAATYLSSKDIIDNLNGSLITLSIKPSTMSSRYTEEQPHMQFVNFMVEDQKLMEYGLGIVYEDGRFVYNEIQPDSMPDNFIKEIVVEDGIFKGKYQDYRYIEIKKGVMLEILMDGTPISLFLKTDILPSSQEELNNIIHKVLINN